MIGGMIGSGIFVVTGEAGAIAGQQDAATRMAGVGVNPRMVAFAVR